MDPNETLRLFWAYYDAGNNFADDPDGDSWEEAFEYAEALCEWMDRGGFQPDWGARGWDAFCVAHGHVDEWVAYLQAMGCLRGVRRNKNKQ